MNALLKIEEAFLFIASLLIYPYLNISWWWFAGCILLPDIGMVGYLIGNKAGAYTYNLFHHKGVAVVVAFCGFCFSSQWLLFSSRITSNVSPAKTSKPVRTRWTWRNS